VDKFCEHGTIVHIDVDPSEINKNKPANLPIVSDIKYALEGLNALVKKNGISRKFNAWHKQLDEWKARARGGPFVALVAGGLGPARLPGGAVPLRHPVRSAPTAGLEVAFSASSHRGPSSTPANTSTSKMPLPVNEPSSNTSW